MENTKLEMLSTMVTSALAKIIDENSTSGSLAELWSNASLDEIAGLGSDLIYRQLHISILEEITSRYIRELNERDELKDFLGNCNIDFLKVIGSMDEELEDIFNLDRDVFDDFAKDNGYCKYEDLTEDDIPQDVRDDIYNSALNDAKDEIDNLWK